MGKSYKMYEYGTSPRKLAPEYTPNRKAYPKPKTKVNPNTKTTKKQTSKKIKNEQKEKEEAKKKLKEQSRKKKQRKVLIYICLGFTILFAISYRNSQIDEAFSDIQKTQKQLAIIEKENEQLEVNIENNSNLNNLEQLAKELLGMQKLSNKQSVYVSLPKVDYIEETQNDDIKEEGFFGFIARNILNIY